LIHSKIKISPVKLFCLHENFTHPNFAPFSKQNHNRMKKFITYFFISFLFGAVPVYADTPAKKEGSKKSKQEFTQEEEPRNASQINGFIEGWPTDMPTEFFGGMNDILEDSDYIFPLDDDFGF